MFNKNLLKLVKANFLAKLSNLNYPFELMKTGKIVDNDLLKKCGLSLDDVQGFAGFKEFNERRDLFDQLNKELEAKSSMQGSGDDSDLSSGEKNEKNIILFGIKEFSVNYTFYLALIVKIRLFLIVKLQRKKCFFY